jgi:hypothetical protein
MRTDFRQHITEADLALLERVLDRAGLSRPAATAGSDARRGATRFLLAQIQQGVTDEATLAAALDGMGVAEAQAIAGEPEQQSSPRSDRDLSSLSTAGGYRYGRRVERNRTWTIYHVFSGVPAEFASWKMVGLNVRTAERALRILNAPVSP